jgi:hypothetical protein
MLPRNCSSKVPEAMRIIFIYYINDMLKSTSVVREEYVVYVVIFSYERAMTAEPE